MQRELPHLLIAAQSADNHIATLGKPALEMRRQPCAGELPVALGRDYRYTKFLGNLFLLQAGKEPEFRDPRGSWIGFLKLSQSFIDSQ